MKQLNYNKGNMTKYERLSVVISILSVFVVLSSLIVSSLMTKGEEENKIATSADIVLLELVRIEEMSNYKIKDSERIITDLENDKYDEIPMFDLDGDFTLLTESEWINHLSVILDELTPKEYYALQNYHLVYRRLDEQYPIKSINEEISEENKEELLKWWRSSQDIMNEPKLNNLLDLKEKLKKIAM